MTTAEPSYRDHPSWLRYQEFFPGGLRPAGDGPLEEWWPWRGGELHLDRLPVPGAPATVVALHGLGGYGRMLVPFGRLPALTGLEFVAVDLPGCGLSHSTASSVRYESWVECVAELVRRRADPRPVVLFGVGTGGRVAYDVAALVGDAVAGVIVTCLADPSRAEVRRRLSARRGLGSLVRMASGPLGAIKIPLRWFADVAAVSDDTDFAKFVWSDPFGGAARIPLRLARSVLKAAPVVEPEHFRGPPVLLAHPERDRWSPTPLSRGFLDRIGTATRFALLGGSGHLPVEERGLGDLDRAVRDFLDELELGHELSCTEGE